MRRKGKQVKGEEGQGMDEKEWKRKAGRNRKNTPPPPPQQQQQQQQ